MKIGVKVLPKSEVLDSQGRAVYKTLNQNGLPLSSVSIGKYIILEIEDVEGEQALQQAQEMAEFVLHNPLTETYTLEVLYG